MREKPDPGNSYERLMLLLCKRGMHYKELATFKDAIYSAARFEDLEKDLESAIRALDFNRIKSAQKAIRAECKRQNWQATLTTLEERVVMIHAMLQQEKRRPRRADLCAGGLRKGALSASHR